MNDWFRSISVLGMAFVAVMTVTLALAATIVPTAGVRLPANEGATPGPARSPTPTAPAQPTAVGGALTITGDRPGQLVLGRETTENRYGLTGDGGRILFESDPVTVARIQYDGLEFFLDPGDCEVEPGERHDPTGVAAAHVRCVQIDDVRGSGTISVEGTVGVAADLFGLRGDLPETGGSVRLGDTTLTFEHARFTLLPFGAAHAGRLVDESMDPPAALRFGYDPQTHGISITEIQLGGDTIAPSDCTVGEERIGLLNPHVRVAELTIRCAAVNVPALGTVPLDGTVIVELAEPPR